MDIRISTSLERMLPQSLVDALKKEINSHAKKVLYIDSVMRFYAWCKTDCNIEFLIEHVLRNEDVLFDTRCSIASYLLSKKCSIMRMTPEQREKIVEIRDEQKRIRQEITRKRVREDHQLKIHIKREKRRRVYVAESTSREMCIQMSFQSLSIDMITHCFSFIEFHSVWRLRSVCKAFYKAYTMSKPYVYVHKITDDVLVPLLKRIAYFCADTILYPDKTQAVEILHEFKDKHLKYLRFKESGRFGLMNDRFVSMVSSCLPLLRFMDDRIIPYCVPIQVYVDGFYVCSTAFRALHMHKFHLHTRCQGVYVHIENEYHAIRLSRNINEIVRDIPSLSWFHIKCTIPDLLVIILTILSLNFSIPVIRSIIIEPVHVQNYVATKNDFDVIMRTMTTVFPQLKTVTIMDADVYKDMISEIPGLEIRKTAQFDPSDSYNPMIPDNTDQSSDTSIDNKNNAQSNIDIDAFFDNDHTSHSLLEISM